jgi:Astacin (Peptidase family M12A)/Bacterial pre-peptidase C-terminal domain
VCAAAGRLARVEKENAMTAAKKLCYDKILPRHLRVPHRSLSQGPRRPARAIAIAQKQWPNGSTITVGFMGGTAEQRDMVRQFAPEWCEHANLRFEFASGPAATIRVSFDADDGAWSYIGKDNLEIPVHAATLNLGWQDRAVILHEFGHMIGLAHEHQSPFGGIEWNEEAVIADLSGPPNFWDPDTIRHNVLDKYAMDQIIGTEFDPESIMLYAFPAEWTQTGQGTDFNDDLSSRDKAFVASSQMYPRPDVQVPELAVHAGLRAAIAAPGEQDVYRFVVAQAGEYVIETGGATDVMMSLYGPNSPTKLIAENDDSGTGRNARIEAALQPGTYVVQVRHFNPGSTGPYRIWVAG